LSSANLIYALNEDMNVRASYSRTLARPQFREIAPVATYEYSWSYWYIGNPNLKRTLIDNYDLRSAWFMRPREILAVSAFYKDFYNPIERALMHSHNGNITYLNVDDAKVIGAEFELRHRLDKISRSLKWFMLSTNLTLIESRIKIPEKRLQELRQYDPTVDDTRPLQGQSPYIINVDLTYDNPETRTSATLAFNTIGRRLYQVSGSETPDIYEQPASILDFVFKQRIFWGFDFKFKMSNVLGSVYRKVYRFNDEDYIREEHQSGKSFSLGLSYEI
jgi:outer membrane receptor protein involved in Fe transport